ncbi:hypothetical protein DBV05_g10383 [Lasiodiplodia theobromae]|uniref:Transcription factor domain-containing protein n=1 Tax=Lasiodiplodia theobromae TaxID=45133 RepID=A0A5N5D0F6_9PEZI|nr:hypothetical protein DBV05_g10383 [Lasiodiplodia theobromae]
MNDLVLMYLENYPGAPPLTDDRLLRSNDAADRALAKRSNTQWHLMITDESSFLIFLAGVACLRNTMSPCRQWQTDYLLLQQDLIRSIRSRMPSPSPRGSSTDDDDSTEKPPIPYIFAVAALGAAGVRASPPIPPSPPGALVNIDTDTDACLQAVFSDLPAALLHLRGARELVRLRGGIESFDGNVLAWRAVTWCEWLVCAACDLYPTITPPVPPPIDATPVYPREFVEEVQAVQGRTRGRLALCGAGSGGRGMRRLDGVFEALTLVSRATTGERWRRVFQAGGPEKDAVAVVLDWVGNVLLVEVVRLVRGDAAEDVVVEVAGDGEDDDGEGAGEEGLDGEDDGEGWVYAVLLHAANAYLCATLSEIPAISALNLVYLRRLRSALEDAVKGSNTHGAGVQQWRGSSSGVEALDATTLMWVLVVGWFLAEKTQAPGKAEFWFWFEARILDLFSVMPIDEDQAAEMVEDFPATDLFRTKWRWLFLQEKFRGLH